MICKPGGKPAGLFLRLNQSCFFIMRLKLFRPFPPGKKKGADFSAPVSGMFFDHAWPAGPPKTGGMSGSCPPP